MSNFKLKIYQISLDATIHAILLELNLKYFEQSVLKPGKMDLLLVSLNNNISKYKYGATKYKNTTLEIHV